MKNEHSRLRERGGGAGSRRTGNVRSRRKDRRRVEVSSGY